MECVVCVDRRMMIEKIAAHLADFSPRLQSNTRALYQYCPIPVVNFPQLDNELFCNIYYLRHLCDSNRFPDWPIRDPVRHVQCLIFLFPPPVFCDGLLWLFCPLQVKLLKDTLDAWKREVEKKPPSMSVDDAYEVLNLPKGQGQWVQHALDAKHKRLHFCSTFLHLLVFLTPELVIVYWHMTVSSHSDR